MPISSHPPPSSLSTAVQEISGAASADHGRRGADQPRRPAAGGGDAGSQRRPESDREGRRGRPIENATQRLDRTKRMRRCWPKADLKIGELSAGVTRSLETTRQSLGLIAGLEGVSRSVDKIVDGIGMVSIQTNMLAVSGSVEAARAGDFGKGFAVVSKDIRSLARDSGDNAGRIKDTVRAIQDQIATVRRELEQIIAAAEAENQKNVGVLASLGSRRDRHERDRGGATSRSSPARKPFCPRIKEAARRRPAGRGRGRGSGQRGDRRRRPPPSSRRAAPRISRRRSRRSPRSPKISSAAMAKRKPAGRRRQADAAAEDQGACGVRDRPRSGGARASAWSFGSRTTRSASGSTTSARSFGCRARPHAAGPAKPLGLANLRGDGACRWSASRACLSLPEAPRDDATRVIVIDGDAPVGFVVDRIDNLCRFRRDRGRARRCRAGGIDPRFLAGVVSGAEGEDTVKIFNPQRLLRDEFAPARRRRRARRDPDIGRGRGGGPGRSGNPSPVSRSSASIWASRNTPCRSIACARSFRCRTTSRKSRARDRRAGRRDVARSPAAARVAARAAGLAERWSTRANAARSWWYRWDMARSAWWWTERGKFCASIRA